MMNTVFKKLMVAYVGIIVVSFLVLGLLFSQMFSNYYFRHQEKLLVEEGDKINDLVVDYLNGYITKERLNLELQSVERFLNTRIWVLDRAGIIYGVSSNEKEWIGKQITEKEMIEVLKGKIIVKKGVFQEAWNTPMLTVGMPIFINGKVVNAIIMHAPLYDITNTLREVHIIIWTAMGISLGISLLVIYFVSKRMSSPLRQIGKAAVSLAEGDFSQRVAVESDDEIGSVTKTFNYMAEKLERIEENRRNFISAVAHELRSPLTLMKGFVQGIVDGTVPQEEQPNYLQIILRETSRLSKLITNLLDLQRMESGQYPIHKQRFDINELIRRTILKYDEEADKRGIQVHLDFSKDKILVLADKDAIEQVLTNVLDNAMKFIGAEGKIQISSSAVESKAHIIIKDNGIGISEEEQAVVWEKFYKADKSRDRNKEGTGLGLYIVKKIIESHEEELKLESQLGEGTTFRFTLSLDEDEEK
ncbi:MAG: ATP-binding protein [Bacillota bacterium]